MAKGDSTDAVVEARLADIKARFGGQLTPEQLAEVRKRIGQSLELSAKLRSTPLTNADEPEIVFAPYRGGDHAGDR